MEILLIFYLSNDTICRPPQCANDNTVYGFFYDRSVYNYPNPQD
jgi:hypothetical protein